jgi:hypothetical protein
MGFASSLLSPHHDLLPSSLKAVELKEIGISELAAIQRCLFLLVRQQGLPLSEVALKETPQSLSLSIVDKKLLMPTSISLS